MIKSMNVHTEDYSVACFGSFYSHLNFCWKQFVYVHISICCVWNAQPVFQFTMQREGLSQLDENDRLLTQPVKDQPQLVALIW